MKNICPTTSARKDVQLLRSTSAAFAAVVAGGTVVTWGDRQGGDSSKVPGMLERSWWLPLKN